jgi:hypothetical protein
MVKVAQGDEQFDDAAKDMGKMTLQIAAVGELNHNLQKLLANSSNEFLNHLAVDSSSLNSMIAAAVIVTESAGKYINGEIDSDQFMIEVGEKGAVMIAGVFGAEAGGILGEAVGTLFLPGIGTIAGAAIGKVIGTVITSFSCMLISASAQTALQIHRELKHMDDYKKFESEMYHLQNEALKEIKSQREQFIRIVENENAKMSFEIEEGFDTMLTCACEAVYDVNGVTEGLDRICAVFGKSVRFKSLAEYEAQVDEPLKLSF